MDLLNILADIAGFMSTFLFAVGLLVTVSLTLTSDSFINILIRAFKRLKRKLKKVFRFKKR